MSEEKTKKVKSGYYVHTMPVKVQAVEEYEKGIFPAQVICQKLGISIPALHNWREQVRKYGDGLILRPRRPEELKLRIVRGIITKMFTIEEASAQYNVSKDSIKKWCAKYSCQISDSNGPVAKKKFKENPPDEDKIHQLEKALEDANLKIIGLETMINIAENDLKIDIRKKSGTKQ
ncbi:MAG: hypothetical protein OJF59_000824 [Cytophagales bacterium]|jgi:transposase-like protein|nr:MAG: hypothetical protein OJF59_000824 [Cytophagales bacterium]